MLRRKASAQNLSHIARAKKDFGAYVSSSLTKQNIDDYIAHRQAAGDADASINRTTQVLGQAYGLAKLPPPEITHLSEKDNVRRGFFSEQEFRAVCEHLESDLRDFCEFAYVTSWRRNEIRSLQWSDLEDNVIHLRAENSKSRKARKVIIDGELVPIIARRRAARMVDDKLTTFVFHRGGEQVGEFQKSWRTACKRAGISRLFHDLRRTGIRNLIRAGVPEKICMDISGHSTRYVFDRYNISSEDDLAAAMKQLQQSREAAADKVLAIRR
jgi:integrase